MHSHRVHTLLATGTFLTLGFASAVAVGAVPHGDHSAVRAAVLAPQHHHVVSARVTHPAADHVRHHPAAAKPATTTARHHRVATHDHSTASVTASTAPAASHPTTSPTPTSTPSRHHHKAGSKHPAKTSPAKPTSTPTTAKLAARTTPSASAVQAAIQGLKKYVHSILSPTPTQVAQFGDLVCSAYDDGDTTAQIEATILQKVSSLPLTRVLPGAADYVVRTAVKLYCPGYKSRLGSAAA